MAPKPRYRPTAKERETIDEVNACIEEAVRWHRPFAARVERRYDAWRGMHPNEAPKTWRSQLHQPLLINIVEGMLSSMEESEPAWQVRPSAVPGLTLEEAVAASGRAKTIEHLLTFQMRVDKFSSKQGPFMQQDLIAGFTPGKVHWLREERTRRYLDDPAEMVYDEAGGTVDIANVLDEYQDKQVYRDDPTFEPRDVRDFLYPESATSVDTAPWIVDRTFVHYTTCERMEALGVYKNCKYLKETRTDPKERDARTSRAYMETTRQGPDTEDRRERRLRSADRTRGLVEIVELWLDDRVVTLGNRTVLLRDEPNPFAHGRKPFVVCSAIPDMFQIPGVSVIEGLAQMQEMVWTLQNLRIDSTRMAANLITLIRGDTENPDEYEWAPGAQWIVTDPNQVTTLPIDASVANVTLQAEALLKGDIQNVMGGLPYTGGAESQTIDQKTATGISIVTNIAQAILQRRKQQYMRVFGTIGQHFLALNQQFLREPRLIEILGPRGAVAYQEIDWQDTQGIYDVDVEMKGDSMMRQERRAESGQLLTQAVQFAGPSAAAGVKLNLKAFWERHLEAFDIPDTETYFMPPAPEQGQLGAGTPPGAETLQAGNAPPTEGITNESLAAGPTSPSSPVTMSPAAPMQQSLAMNGAGRSV